MKFVIEKANLLDNLNKVSKAITGKSTIDTLKGVLIEVQSNQIIMVASDMDLTIYARGTCEVIEPGKVLIDSKMFTEIVRKLPNGDVNIEITEDNLVFISCKKTKFSVVKMDETKYPELKSATPGTGITISKEIFRKMVSQVQFAVALDSTRPILQGILYEVKNNTLKLVALDGYRIAYTQHSVENANDIEAVIDGKSLSNISKLIDNDGVMKLFLNDNHILILLDNLTIHSRLMDGKYINYQSLMNNDYNVEVIVDRVSFIESIERSTIIAGSEDSYTPLITLKSKSDGMLDMLEITSKSPKGKVMEDIAIEIPSKDKEIEIAFNGRYLLDMLKSMESEKVDIKFKTNLSPATFYPIGNEDNKYVVLPIRVQK